MHLSYLTHKHTYSICFFFLIYFFRISIVGIYLHMNFSQKVEEMVNYEGSEPVVIVGFGQMGQVC